MISPDRADDHQVVGSKCRPPANIDDEGLGGRAE
jgi:hypothetical protein